MPVDLSALSLTVLSLWTSYSEFSTAHPQIKRNIAGLGRLLWALRRHWNQAGALMSSRWLAFITFQLQEQQAGWWFLCYVIWGSEAAESQILLHDQDPCLFSPAFSWLNIILTSYYTHPFLQAQLPLPRCYICSLFYQTKALVPNSAKTWASYSARLLILFLPKQSPHFYENREPFYKPQTPSSLRVANPRQSAYHLLSLPWIQCFPAGYTIPPGTVSASIGSNFQITHTPYISLLLQQRQITTNLAAWTIRIYYFIILEVRSLSQGYNQGVTRTAFFLKALGNESISLPFLGFWRAGTFLGLWPCITPVSAFVIISPSLTQTFLSLLMMLVIILGLPR